MATKEEILQDIEDKRNNKDEMIISTFYRFKEGERIALPKPESDVDMDNIICKILASGETKNNNLYLLALLYYRTLKDSAPADRVSGIASLDNNLFNRDNPMESKTSASAAFLPKEEVICVRGNIFSGDSKQTAYDIVCALHESRHYHQFLNMKKYTKTISGKVDGGMSEKERLEYAFRIFESKDMFPYSDKKSFDKFCYCMYHQQDVEIDAREYSFSAAEEIIQRAIAGQELSAEEKTNLISILEEVKKERLKNINENEVQRELYDSIVARLKRYSKQVQKQAEDILSDENIAKLEHHDERDPETEGIRQYMFKLEASLFVNYDENLARLIEKICCTYRVYAVGRKLMQHPDFIPSEEFFNRVIKDDIGLLLFGESELSPPYDSKEVAERYAELKSGQPGLF